MKEPSVLRIVPLPAATASGSIKPTGKSPLKASGPRAFEATTTFEGVHRSKDGEPLDLDVRFSADAAGRIGVPVLRSSSSPAAAATPTSGPCAPIKVTYGNPKKTRWFFPCGVNTPGLVLGSSASANSPLVLEFRSRALADRLTIDVKLWRDGEGTAAARSSGEIMVAAEGKNA
jgi:hypothetical protein